MRRIFSAALAVMLLVLVALPAGAQGPAGEEVTILFTHDLHSNLLPFTRMDDDGPNRVGGFSRLKTALDEARAGRDALVVDGGDFSMGTLFQTIFASEASELRMLGSLGFDATTLGNHEFDFGTQGLADMFHTAAQSGEALPQLLFNAGDFAYAENPAPATPLEDLSDGFHSVGTKETMIIEKNGVRIGLFSAFGEDSVMFSPTMEITVPGIVENAKEAVAELKAQGAEMIVCLSHSGTNPDPKKSEDELLAAAVPEIDVIISGHTHTYLYEPIIAGNTVIASCGEYSQFLGEMTLVKNGERWSVAEYRLVPIDESVAPDPQADAEIAAYKAIVEEEYLSNFGDMTFDEVAGRTKQQMPFDVYTLHGESLLGNFISDAYTAAAGAEKPVDVAVTAAGYVRWGIPEGEITFADAFNVSSLGIGEDGLSGYPLIDVYLTGEELWNAAEVDASVTPLMIEAQLYFSGFGFTFNPNRLIFNKVTDAWLVDEAGARVELEKDKLYRVVCGLNAALMLGSVKEQSFGLLSIVPKDENGAEITDFNARILKDAAGAEIKEWFAIARYFDSFAAGADGVPVVSDYYYETHGRKVVDESRGIANYTTKLNRISYIVYGIVLVLVLLLIFIIYRIATRKKRKLKKQAKKEAKSK